MRCIHIKVYVCKCVYLYMHVPYKEVKKRSYIYVNINNMHKVYVKFNSH